MSKIKCLECNTILESKHRYDFQSCDCPNASYIDGGDNYLRFGCVDLSKIVMWNKEKQEFLEVKYLMQVAEEDKQLKLF